MSSGAIPGQDTFDVYKRFNDVKYLNFNPPIFCLLLFIPN